MTRDEFVQRAVLVHGGKYGYNKVNYIDSKTKVEIFCNSCKEYFWQFPHNHLKYSCKKCSIINAASNRILGKDEFIRRSILIHGGKYGYDKVNYINSETKVKIYCNNCKDYFLQSPFQHYNMKHGCPRCSAARTSSKLKMTKDEFIQRAILVHGNKYGYNKVNYINSKTKIEIYCNRCKEYFIQTPSNHLGGHGCKCINKIILEKRRKTNQKFIEEVKEIHGNKYDYSKFNYASNREIGIIICPIHGEFHQSPRNHLNGHGCKKCGAEASKNNGRKTTKNFIEESKKVHGDKYNYDKVNYINAFIPVEIYCSNCEKYFTQIPRNHLKGHGCKTCGNQIISRKMTSSTEEFIMKANKIHGNKYNYSKVNYTHNRIKVEIICKTCNQQFKQEPVSHLVGCGCPHCQCSETQKELHVKISEFTQIEINNRKIITPQELDIWIPNHNLAIELNGTYWHSEARHKNKYYHYNKYLKCKEKQITLTQIYETEWYNKPKQVISYIKTKLNQNKIIQPNNCNIITLNKQQYNQFQTSNTILYTKPGNTLLGLQYNNQLVATINIHNNQLLSYIELLWHTVPEGLNKLLQHHNKPITYNDNLRYTIKDQLINFTHIKTLKPEFCYNNSKVLYHKYYYPKHKFKNYDPKLEPVENMKNNGYYRLWDAGYEQWSWVPML